jgi:hypothetical protein
LLGFVRGVFRGEIDYLARIRRQNSCGSQAPDAAFIYFVQGEPPNKLGIWRIRPGGGAPERITSHNARVTYPVWLDRRTLVYLASDPDGSGPWLYGRTSNMF